MLLPTLLLTQYCSVFRCYCIIHYLEVHSSKNLLCYQTLTKQFPHALLGAYMHLVGICSRA